MPRIPYLHYYYTWKWLEERNMPDIAHIAANHSTWDLEFENLPIESLILIYADFRVRAERGEDGREITIVSPLTESRDRIFVKLADMTPEKRLRYETVYKKLDDFERFLISHGVNTDPKPDAAVAAEKKDAALLCQGEVIRALNNHAFDNNIHLMHTISVSDTFEALLEQARDEKNLSRIRTYLLLFEEYSTYMTRTHKLLTLRFLYELLMHHDGDVRRHAGRIMGAILANSGPRYRKELPRGAGSLAIAPALHAVLSESTTLWDHYIELCLHPDYKISQKHAMRISNSLKTIAGEPVCALHAGGTARILGQALPPHFLQRRGGSARAHGHPRAHSAGRHAEKRRSSGMLPILGEAAASAEARARIRALRSLSAVANGDPALLAARGGNGKAAAGCGIYLRLAAQRHPQTRGVKPAARTRVSGCGDLPEQPEEQHLLDDEAGADRPALRICAGASAGGVPYRDAPEQPPLGQRAFAGA